VPKELLSLLGKDSALDVQLGDQVEKAMTVLFSDLRDFTSLSESLKPEENFNLLNSYLGQMAPIIRRNGGIIDKYIGDAIMALFPKTPFQAFEAAQTMRKKLQNYNAGRARAGYKPLEMGIGLHFGNLMLGTIGERSRMDGTVISDVV
jgi:class 3 adenylate cyclase